MHNCLYIQKQTVQFLSSDTFFSVSSDLRILESNTYLNYSRYLGNRFLNCVQTLVARIKLRLIRFSLERR